MKQPETQTSHSETDSDNLFAAIHLDQSYTADAICVARPLITVPVRKPTKAEFFRASRTEFQDCLILERKEERETYVVYSRLQGALAQFVDAVRLRLCVNRQGTVFLWPVKLPREDLRGDSWRRSAMEAAALAEDNWVRVAADMNAGAYQPFVATADLGEAQWPKESLQAIVKVAFKGQIIDSMDHAVVRQLMGLV